MNRRLALRLAVLVSAAGALSVACSISSDREESSESTGQALRPVGSGEPPVVLTPVKDAGHDSGKRGPVLVTQTLFPPAWATQCTTTRYFVRRGPFVAKMAAQAPPSLCTNVDSPNGKWTGSPLFPEASASHQCVYDWTPNVAHASAATVDDLELQSFAATTDATPVPECSSATCGVGTSATCTDVPSVPACDDTDLDAGCHHQEFGPICESCAVVHEGALMVVLPPSLAGVHFVAKPQGKVGVSFVSPTDTQTFRVPVTPGDFPEDTMVDLLMGL